MAPEPLQAVAADSDDEDDEKKTTVWQRSHHAAATTTTTTTAAGGGGGTTQGDEHANDVLSQDFLRKYIYYAKRKVKPELTEEAREFIANAYAEMRSKQDDKTLPVTARR
jgi:DNA replicative helicase MCM subunit Mcm2 (Cdc46/Mcm family)